MLGTIANALAARVGRTPGRVGFALGWKLLLWYAIFYFGKRPISTASAGFGAKWECGRGPGVGVYPLS